MFVVKPEGEKWPASANVYIIKDEEGLTMIDSGCGSEKWFNALLAGMKAYGLDLRDVHTLLLSHAHPDHMGATSRVLKAIKPKIIMHEVDAPNARNPKLLIKNFDISLIKSYYPSFNFDLLGFFRESSCSMCQAEPNVTVKEGDYVYAGKFSFRIIHTPGHAPGHICLYEEERKLLFSGDLIGAIPAWYSPSSGGALGYMESLAKIERLEVDLILPSHGIVIDDPARAINETRRKLTERDREILRMLDGGKRTFYELNEPVFKGPMKYFPGVVITESHLIKLEREGKIERLENKMFRARLESYCKSFTEK